MSRCSYPRCQDESTVFHQPRTWLERVAEVDIGPGLCPKHEFFRFIDPEAWENAGMDRRAIMEIQAMEDFEAAKALARFRDIQAESWSNR